MLCCVCILAVQANWPTQEPLQRAKVQEKQNNNDNNQQWGNCRIKSAIPNDYNNRTNYTLHIWLSLIQKSPSYVIID